MEKASGAAEKHSDRREATGAPQPPLFRSDDECNGEWLLKKSRFA
jgi:hypothetical protein